MSAACAASLTRPRAPALRVRASAPRGRALVVRSVAADDAVDSAVDADAASTSAVDATATSSSPGASEGAAEPLKKRLMALAAASGRGQDATSAQKTAASGLVADLIAVNPTPEPARDPSIAGDWELVYADTHLFRSSPFFWAVGRMMGPENADFFYDAHAHQTGIFGGGVGRVVQSIDLRSRSPRLRLRRSRERRRAPSSDSPRSSPATVPSSPPLAPSPSTPFVSVSPSRPPPCARTTPSSRSSTSST